MTHNIRIRGSFITPTGAAGFILVTCEGVFLNSRPNVCVVVVLFRWV